MIAQSMRQPTMSFSARLTVARSRDSNALYGRGFHKFCTLCVASTAWRLDASHRAPSFFFFLSRRDVAQSPPPWPPRHASRGERDWFPPPLFNFPPAGACAPRRFFVPSWSHITSLYATTAVVGRVTLFGGPRTLHPRVLRLRLPDFRVSSPHTRLPRASFSERPPR